ncbi:olfactory receptor 52E8-like [Mantella aurantiaca]
MNNFLLLGLLELETFRYPYCIFSTVVYLSIILLSSVIVYIVVTEESLHEPMFILICNLVLNGIFGSSSFFPKLFVDLITSSKTISRIPCILQIHSLMTFTFYEIFTFALMAYDRYLAVCQPLRYITLMTLEMVMKISIGSLIFCFSGVLVAVILSARLPLCGNQIKSIFCDNMSFFILSCVDSSVNNIYGATGTLIFLSVTMIVIFYSYVRIFVECWAISKEAHKKAIHTLLMHLINFSVFLVGLFFVFVRHRLSNSDLPISVHILLSICLVVVPPLLNPFIYGVRTRSLRKKIVHFLQKRRVVAEF